MKRNGKKNRYITYVIGAVTVLLITSHMPEAQDVKKENQIQASLADKVIRLHVVANSDEAIDQELKLKVKNEIVEKLRKDLRQANNKREAEARIHKELKNLEKTANSTIAGEGFDYSADASLGVGWFPVKMYGDMIFPEGEYEALKIEIGKATGKNWWCVMFPTLCFVDETYQVVPDESKEMLKEELTYEEYKQICGEEEGKVEYRSRLADWWNSLWE